MRKSLKERFEKYVYPEPNTGCWLWGAGIDSGGYGNFHFNGRLEKAHRISYIINISEIPTNRHVLHSCDNRFCVNPDHLWLGSNAENIKDKVSKNRQAKGEKIHGVITVSDVLIIRSSVDHNKLLSERFNVSLRTIQLIKKRKTWRHI